MVRILAFFILFFPIALRAQFTYGVDQSVTVIDLQGNNFDMAWAGGLNAAQYNTIDLNGDGKDDLALFDKMANKVITLLNDNNQYRYAPEYESLFPDEITNWILLRDYNCDGKKDIFTGDIFGMKVFTNTTAPGENISWKPYLFYVGPGSPKSEALLTLGFSGKINLQLQSDDLPVFVDADGDGDLDIFNMRYSGKTMEFHQNFSIERYATCDSLDFERQTLNWGEFSECNCEVFAFNNEDCPPSAPIDGRTKHAGGKSLLVMDTDGDADLDVLFSEATCTQLYLLENKGTNLNPIINSATIYPSANPVDFVIFPAAFYEDVDFDGDKDLLSSPNIFSRVYFNSDLKSSSWLYKNSGSTDNPSFTLTQKNFLQEKMIDLGDNTVPAFADYDGDYDYDMFLSRFVTDEAYATISLFKNTGTPTVPVFTWVDNDYLSLSTAFFYNLKIQFVDMNSDGKTDLVFTATSQTDGKTNLYFLPNQSNSLLDFSNQALQLVDFTLAQNENIRVADINLDGLLDLLVGKSNGALQYWKNNGPAGTQNYSLESDQYLGFGSSVLRQNMTSAVADLDGDRKSELLLGDQYGKLTIIPDFRKATDQRDAVTEVIYNPITLEYESQNLGGRIWSTVVNLFNSNRPAIVVGTTLGGVRLLRNDEAITLPEVPVINVYPNPVSIAKQDYVTILSDRSVELSIFSAIGQKIRESILIEGGENFLLKVPYLSPGIYILRFSVNNIVVSRRLIIY